MNKWKVLLFIFSIFVIGVFFFWRLNDFLIERKFTESLKNRTLVIVIENNFNMPNEIEQYYDDHKNIVDSLISFVLKVDKKELVGKSLSEVVDIYGEDYQAQRFKNAAKGYGRIVILSDKKASYDNFKKTLLSLNKEERPIDILLDLHGGPDVVVFYESNVAKESIKYDMSQMQVNLGYVYQTLCWGSQNEDVWLDAGAKVVNGAKGRNNFVILAPEKFLHLWTHGKTFTEAVSGGYDFEVSIFSMFKKIIPVLPVENEDIESGRMIFAGDNSYSLSVR